MKPTPQLSSNQRAARSFPLTDYSFQATAQASANTAAVLPATKPRILRGRDTSRLHRRAFFLHSDRRGRSMACPIDARLPGLDENCVLASARLPILASKVDHLRGMDVVAGANFLEQVR